jgi:hypothetical protein
MRNLDDLFHALGKSAFRRRFSLRGSERAYLRAKGLDVVMAHAADLIRTRLAAAEPRNDGRQTPMGKHPVFVAQHATATCCRGCLVKWHDIPRGRELAPGEQSYILSVLRRWLIAQIDDASEFA